MTTMNIYAIGASRNIGYYAAQRLLEKGATVTFLLRNTSVFDQDADMKRFVTSGKARLIQGDALRASDVKRGWEEACSLKESVNAVLFSVGGTPRFSVTRGLVVDPHNLCTQSILNVLSTIPANLRTPETQPRLVVVSSLGLTRASHAKVPIPLKPMYALLRVPHADKLGLERVVAHCAGRAWTEEEPRADIIGTEWASREGLLSSGELKHAVVIRPALLTDGACKGDSSQGKPPYKVTSDEMTGFYTVSRRDVAHFIVEGVLAGWERWDGQCINISY
ncbi:hypothetical protein CERSUDRAFT_64307 [Gelatoporia subvermispora B]|uniref:NAD(P)-binding domain-containing protein n=1 Tax=Ceriporiopsis subvermispora (strain B) TaxID=914234 RepID=M2QLX3_CERS8|nr:hypothetical protein CERSUDRAFT_64307 [Gelatoporia subvermispora B]